MDEAILVLSCDKYSHIWPAFFKCLDTHFSDRSVPVYLGSNTVSGDFPGVKVLLSGEDRDWSSSLLSILAQIPEKRIFIILEDLLIASALNLIEFRRTFDFMKRNRAMHVKYYKPIPPDRDVPGHPFGAYDSGRPYRVSVVGFWDKAYLAGLLIAGESPWNFEIMGSYRASYADGFYMMKNTLCDFTNMIEKGRWYPAAARWAESEGLDIGFEKRPMLAGGGWFKSAVQIAVYRAVAGVPWRLRVRLMNFLRRILISY